MAKWFSPTKKTNKLFKHESSPIKGASKQNLYDAELRRDNSLDKNFLLLLLLLLLWQTCSSCNHEDDSKLKEMATLHKSYNSRVMEKEEVLAQERGQAADTMAKLNWNEVLL